jgi:hypothetical protein
MIVARVEGDEERGAGDGRFGGESDATTADDGGAVGLGATPADAIGVGEEGQAKKKMLVAGRGSAGQMARDAQELIAGLGDLPGGGGIDALIVERGMEAGRFGVVELLEAVEKIRGAKSSGLARARAKIGADDVLFGKEGGEGCSVDELSVLGGEEEEAGKPGMDREAHQLVADRSDLAAGRRRQCAKHFKQLLGGGYAFGGRGLVPTE